ALENLRMAFPLYPQMEVVQTGPGRNDWKVCTYDGEKDYGPEEIPGGARFGVGGGTPPFTAGNTWCLDVLGALRDPNRNIPSKNHWTLVDTGSEVRPDCCPTASLIEIDGDGRTVTHKKVLNKKRVDTIGSLEYITTISHHTGGTHQQKSVSLEVHFNRFLCPEQSILRRKKQDVYSELRVRSRCLSRPRKPLQSTFCAIQSK
ncbi:MAG: hypothetical protein ACREBC_39515, partial [Pyrinomonadaceae bacterium]